MFLRKFTHCAMVLLFTFTFVLSLTACKKNDETIITQPLEGSMSTEYPASQSTDDADITDNVNELPMYPLLTYTTNVSDHKGYTVTQIVDIGAWVKASDTEKVAAAWSAVGGIGAPPKAEDFNGGAQSFKTDESAIIFGKMTMVNATEGYKFSSTNPYSSKWMLFLVGTKTYNSMSKMAVWFSDGKRIYENGNRDGHFGNSIYGNIPSANMTSNRWGSVPFVIVLREAFTPNDPDGISAFSEVQFKLGVGDKTFVPKMPNVSEISVSELLGLWIGDDGSELEFTHDNTVIRTTSVSSSESEYFVNGSQIIFGENGTLTGIMQNGQLVVTYAGGAKETFNRA